jgi:hypothetical protein
MVEDNDFGIIKMKKKDININRGKTIDTIGITLVVTIVIIFVFFFSIFEGFPGEFFIILLIGSFSFLLLIAIFSEINKGNK